MAVVPGYLETSLPVPSVQELPIQRLGTVPRRYIFNEINNETSTASDLNLHVPLIDMTKLVNPVTHDQELLKLHSACKEWGIFQLINHGVGNELINKMRKQVEGFFELPLQEKKRWAQQPGSLQGYGQAFVMSEEQKLDWNDMIFFKALPLDDKKLNFCPDKPHQFRETLESYSENIRNVTVSLMRFIAVGLGLEAPQFSDCYKQGSYQVRMNCYPPCPEPERVIGIKPHVDISGITLLPECGDMPGLQVLKDGKWVLIKPINSSIVVNLGHITQIMSNGIYKASDHRAVVNKMKERLSIVTFCYPNPSADVGPAGKLTESGSPPLLKTLKVAEYMQIFYNHRFDFPFIDSLKI